MKILTKLPKDACSSPHLKEKAEGWIAVMYFGITYYILVSKEFKKAFKVKRKRNILIFPSYEQEKAVESFLRDLIASMYLQIRDTVGSEIHQQLSEEITDGFAKLLSKNLESKVDGLFDRKMLDYKQEGDRG